MKLADLNQHITIRRLSSTSDGAGGCIKEWNETQCSPTWANIKDRSASEIIRGNQDVYLQRHIVTVQHCIDIRVGDRVIFEDDTTTLVKSVSKIDRGNHYWTQMVVENEGK